MAKIDLVFRQIDERTRDVALELAKESIRPDNTYIIDDVRPFTECVNQMLRIDHDCDYVVYVDADCLILDDLRAFVADLMAEEEDLPPRNTGDRAVDAAAHAAPRVEAA